MKFENNNKGVIKKITKRSLKTNRIRNLFAILAVVLTTFMISSVFSIGFSFIKNNQTMNVRLQGTTATVVLPNPSDAQIKEIESLNILSSMGQEIVVGRVELDSLKETRTSVSVTYLDNANFEQQFKPAISEVEGNYPKTIDEIMISRKSLDFLGQSALKLGDTIEVPIKVNGEIMTKQFKLSGLYTDFGVVQDSSRILVSELFVKEYGLTTENNGRLYMTVKSAEKNVADEVLEGAVTLKDKQEFLYSYDQNADLGETALITVALVGMIGLFIVLSGYLLIYNVLYIAVTKDINFYGLLKTIGTSPSQIKKIVRGQALKLSIIGIPVGLLLGAIVSFGVVPMVMGTFFVGTMATAMPGDVSFNPIIFITATLFSLVTVMLSCHKPAKIAATISPTEALRYTGAKPKKQKQNRKSTTGGKLYKMAWYNVFREPKRAVLVFLSLFMGVITFLSVQTFLNSMSVDNYIDRYVENDFDLTTLLTEEGELEDKYDDDLINTIKEMQGVTQVMTSKATLLQLDMNEDILMPSLIECYTRFMNSDEGAYEFLESVKKNPEALMASVIGVSDNFIDKVLPDIKEKIDIESFKNGDLILLNAWYYGDDYQEIGGTLTVKTKDGKGEKQFKVQVVSDSSHLLAMGIPAPLGISEVYMSEKALEELDPTAANFQLFVDCEDKYEAQIEPELKKISDTRGLWFESKSDKTEDFKSSQMVMNILGGGISLILIFIGILNFINVMITGVNIRLKEFAVLESIGMTKKQIKKLLTLEGFYYAAITCAFISTIGVGIIYLVATMTKQIADYAVFVFPTVPLVALMLVIFAICLITPSFIFKVASKKSVTERIREIEN